MKQHYYIPVKDSPRRIWYESLPYSWADLTTGLLKYKTIRDEPKVLSDLDSKF